MDITGKKLDYRFRDRIPEVRQVFTKKIQDIPSEHVYPEDIQKTMTQDHWVERFLEWHRGSIDKTVDGLIFSHKYMKRYRVRELSDSDFASEAFSSGGSFLYEPDYLGRPVLYIRSKFGVICRETREMSKQLGAYLFHKIEEQAGEKGFVLVNDFAGTSLSNIDFKMVWSSSDILSVLPNACPLSITVNLAFAFRAMFNKIVKYAIPADQRNGILLLTPEELRQVIPVESIPDFLGGTCPRPHKGPQVVPEKCLPMHQLMTSFIAEKDKEKGSPSLILLPDKLESNSIPQILACYEKVWVRA